MNNPCIRCGSQRIFSKTWEEVVELYSRQTTITNTEFVCPDAKCQKLVEIQLAEQSEKRKFIENQKELEKKARAKQRASNIARARNRF